MSRLVDDLLTLARADAGRGRLTLEPLDFSEVILDVVERLRPLAQSQAVRLQMDELPELPINGDRRYLEQLLANVIENGIKYGYGADRWVRVEAGCPTIATDQLIWVRVTDNGLGIPAQHLSHIFDRFYRVDQARSEAGGEAPGGSGLGLSIVQWIAEAHGGQVTAQSSGVPGEGTLFEIRLPVIH